MFLTELCAEPGGCWASQDLTVGRNKQEVQSFQGFKI